MTTRARAGAALAIFAAALSLYAEARGWSATALVAKPVPVLLLALAVLRRPRQPLGGAVAAGLFASAIGDVVIDLPGGFLAGLGAFLVAHLFYLAGFWRGRPEPCWGRAAPFALYATLALALLLPRLAGTGVLFPLAVTAYAVTISTMLWRASALVGAPRLPRRVGISALAGALLFAASDSLIAVDRFVATLPWSDLPIMLLYWAGQAGITFAGAALDPPTAGRTRIGG